MSSSPIRGLEQRLKTRSRRSGLMIGVSVVSAIVLMVGAFTMIYAMLDPFVGDFIQDGAGNNPEPTRNVAQFAATIPPDSDAPEPTATVSAADPPTTVPPTTVATPPADAFNADYRVSSAGRINFREGQASDFPSSPPSRQEPTSSTWTRPRSPRTPPTISSPLMANGSTSGSRTVRRAGSGMSTSPSSTRSAIPSGFTTEQRPQSVDPRRNQRRPGTSAPAHRSARC